MKDKMRYQSIPTIIEAEQFLPGSNLPNVLIDKSGEHYVVTHHMQKEFVNYGDWIISEGETYCYPCKDNEFTKKYKLVEENKIEIKSEHKMEHKTEDSIFKK